MKTPPFNDLAQLHSWAFFIRLMKDSGFACFWQEANTFASQSTTYADGRAVCPPAGDALEGSIVMEFDRIHAAAHIGHMHNAVTAGLK